MTPAPPVITVDGPAGSGKTTLGRLLARRLGLPLVDTGLFYRAVLVAALRAGVDTERPAAAAEVAARTQIELNTDPAAPEDGWQVRVDGVDAGDDLRDPRLATRLAAISAVPAVRTAVLDRQRAAARRGAVAVGRDCGTVVFPAAPVKLFLWASPEERARRRALQLATQGVAVDEAALAAEIAGRDASDSGRAVSPLRPAPDAHHLDTGALDAAAALERALALCAAAGIGPAPAGAS